MSVLVLLAAALLCFAGAVRGAGLRPRMVGAPQPIEDPENDEGLERALQFAMTAYNRASNDMYSSRVVRVISAQRQVSPGAALSPRGLGTCNMPAGFLWRKGRSLAWGPLQLLPSQKVNKSPFLYLGFSQSE